MRFLPYAKYWIFWIFGFVEKRFGFFGFVLYHFGAILLTIFGFFGFAKFTVWIFWIYANRTQFIAKQKSEYTATLNGLN